MAEVDKVILQEIGSADLASAKPVITRAFNAAKALGAGNSPDYVEKSEFRLLLVYLRQYFELYVAYNRLDTSDDRRLSLPEFREGVQLLAQWGIDIPEQDIESEFASIDTNHGGIILFDEFCDWALRKQLDLEDDDDWADDEPTPSGASVAPALAPAEPLPVGKRRALIVGINYFGGKVELDGCVADAARVKSFLVEHGFPDDPLSMRMLTDDAPTTSLMPTRANLLRGIDWLVKGAARGDALFFHFSGHGTQQPDEEAIEADGFDECIVPCDHERSGLISDDQLFDRLVRPLAAGVRVTALMDCCHSGTGLDLPFTVQEGSWCSEEGPLSKADADVRLFSGCQDGQESDDAVDAKGKPSGAMTHAFLAALPTRASPTYEGLMSSVTSALAAAGHSQQCSLSASMAFDLSVPFSLTDVATPRSAQDLPPAKAPLRPAGTPKPKKKKFKTRSLGGSAGASPFNAPPRSQWQEGTRNRAAGSGGATAVPLASERRGSNLAGAADVDWRELTAKLPTGRDAKSKDRRRSLFGRFDANGNGYLSLAEVDKAVRDELGSAELFSSKPVLMRAFQAAKGVAKTGSTLGADYVEYPEFRLLLVYLRQYFELDAAYNRLDTSDDRRLSLPEFREGVQLLAQWGIDIPEQDIESEFASIDTNHGGIILFDEFCDWALRKQLDLEDDDDFDDDADVRCVTAASGAGHAPPAARGSATRATAGGGAQQQQQRASWNDRAAARAAASITPHASSSRRLRGSSASGSGPRAAGGGTCSADALGSSLPAASTASSGFGCFGNSECAGSRPGTAGGRQQAAGGRPGTAGGSTGSSRAEIARAAAAKATDALEARSGGGSRLPYDRPLVPPALSRPLGPGPMPARPLSATGAHNPKSRSASRSPSKAYGGRGVGDSEFKPVDEVIAPVKPRVTGGMFSKADRSLNNNQHDPFIAGGGKAINQPTFGATRNQPTQVFPPSQPLKGGLPGQARPLRGADSGAPGGGALQGDFVIDSTVASTATFRR